MSRATGRFIVINGVRVFPRQVILVPILIVLIFIFANVFLRLTTTRVAEWSVEIGRLHSTSSKQACVQPEIDPHALPKELIPKEPEPLNCDTGSKGNEADWLIANDNNEMTVHPNAMKAINEIPGQSMQCDIIEVERDGDDGVKFGQILGTLLYTQSSDSQPFVKLPNDVYTVLGKCRSEKMIRIGNSEAKKQERIYMAITRRQSVLSRVKALKPPNSNLINVVIVMVDSLSRAAWQRHLPKTVKYFTENLKGTVLEGYNIVGDGTPQNMFPILMGLSEFEMPEARRFQPGAKTLDDLPWLFKTFKEQGYVTLATEDMPMFSMYNYRFVGFKESPCDFYTRPFYLAVAKNQPVWQSLGIVRDFCHGNEPKHMLPIKWLNQMFKVYKDEPKFALLTFAEVTHDDNAKATWIDNDLETLLKNFEREHYLDNTLMVVLSDHGARYDNLRATLQGKLEERLPFVGIFIPEQFRKNHAEATRILEEVNQKRLATPYDLHNTLVDLLELTTSRHGVERFDQVTPVPGRAQSLFREVPLGRTCEMAKIESHWCACIAWVSVSKEDKTAKMAAEHVLAYINSLTKPAEQQCHRLTLGSIVSAEMLTPNKDLLHFRQTNDRDGYKADLTDTMVAAQVIYQVTFEAKPSGGKYFATVVYWPRNGYFTFDGSKALSRLDRYGSQPWCVVESHPQLRPFCYCKEQKKENN